ncbi:cytidyltransferase [Ignicoccus pacificus DSM 13166]|uniref:Cytidyltransferase n=1 Tax=Ignicoccus pacificus DSM 13166 TaxID=940294 RepID=A0A977K9P6_9CREN|nr:cytidyltransferase [Ignicoccus pacificus DSM 13166]
MKLCERAERYLRGLKEVLDEIEYDEKARKVVELARLYVEDTIYYINKGDCETALVTASYAEGLLDALRMLGLARFSWPKREQKRVVVGGTFDLLHPGHVELFKEASKYGDVIAIVARDETVKRLRGRDPVLPQEQRRYMVSSIKYVKEAIIGGKDPIETVAKLKPDYVFLGPDQNWDEEELERALRERGLNVKVIRMKGKKCIENGVCSSSKIIERVLELFCRRGRRGGRE